MLLGSMAMAPRLYRLHRRAAAVDSGEKRTRSAPSAEVEVGGDRLASVARRAGAVAELETGEGGSATTRR
jgi:hypothetical protein